MSTPSEQESGLELDREPPQDDPEGWQTVDPDEASPDGTGEDERPGEQLTAPGEGGTLGDEEATEIANDAGPSHTAGPEAQAMRIDDEPPSGSTGR